MKLKFKNQQFQTDAVNAVVDLLAGQEKNKTTFSVVEEAQPTLFNELGVGNSLLLDEAAVLSNMQEIQKRHNLPLTQFGSRNAESGIRHGNSELLRINYQFDSGRGCHYRNAESPTATGFSALYIPPPKVELVANGYSCEPFLLIKQGKIKPNF